MTLIRWEKKGEGPCDAVSGHGITVRDFMPDYCVLAMPYQVRHDYVTLNENRFSRHCVAENDTLLFFGLASVAVLLAKTIRRMVKADPHVRGVYTEHSECTL